MVILAAKCSDSERGANSLALMYSICSFIYLFILTHGNTTQYKNSSGDETGNVNFYAVRPEATRIRQNNAK